MRTSPFLPSLSIATWTSVLSALALSASLVACGGGEGSGGSAGSAAGGASSGQSTGGSSAGAGGSSAGAAGSTGTGGTPPAPTCPAPKDAVDTSNADATVGAGTAESCTEGALDTALAKGGVVTFNCGSAPVTITVTSEKQIQKDTVIDGGGKVTLSGGGKTRILHLASAWDQTSPRLTVQHLAFTGGFTSDAPNTKETTQGGAAIFREGGSLDVIDCQFTNNTCASSGQDVSGGAITSQGVGDTVVVGSTFSNNSGSNGGAVGNLGNNFTVVNSSFDKNSATGTDGNPGNGGNGGALVFDGADTQMVICGCSFTNNSAGAQGGAVFRVAYSDEPTTIDRCTFDANSADPAVGLAGALYLENTTIAMTASTISNNKAHYGGGMWIGHAALSQIVNVTIANNKADQGGGVWVAGEVTGSLLNCTLAGNDVNPGGYAPGVFSGDTALELKNCLIVGGGCRDNPLGDGGQNMQFPDSSAPCTGAVTVADPLLGALMDNGGPTRTIAPGAGSPAVGVGVNCPATDQRGEARPDKCTLGAYEGSK